MRTNVRWKDIDSPRTFIVGEELNLPMFTMRDNLIGTRRTFKEGGKFEGTPCIAQIVAEAEDGNFKPFKQVKGVLVKEDGGVYIVPFKAISGESYSNAEGEKEGGVAEGVEKVAEGAKEVAKEVVEEVK